MLVTLAMVLREAFPTTAIRRANFDRLAVGMTLEQVEEILQGPARDESTGPCRVPLTPEEREAWDSPELAEKHRFWQFYSDVADSMALSAPRPYSSVREWKSDEAWITLILDETGRLSRKAHLPLYRDYDGLWDRVKSLLRMR